MPSLLVRIILFLSSYAPLLIIMAIKSQGKHPHLMYILLSVACLSVLILWGYLRVASRLSPTLIRVEQLAAKDTEGMSYIVTYLIPFLDLKLDDPRSAAALLCLFAVVGVLYVNSNMIYINPMLNVFGFHLFEIETSGKKKEALLTRKSYIERGATIRVVSLGNLVVMEC